MREFIFDTDLDTAIDVEGLPTCPTARRQIREARPLQGCGNAIVGEGRASFDFYFPEIPPMSAKGRLIVYNAGIEGRTTNLFAYAYLVQPITTTMVMPIRIGRIREGRFTRRATVTVPKIANDLGRLTSFRVTIGKRFIRNGKRASVLTAKCPTGKLHALARANFADGTSLRSGLGRECAPSD